MKSYREWAGAMPDMEAEDKALVLGFGAVIYLFFVWPFKLAWWLISRPMGLASLAGFVATGALIGLANAWALVQWALLLVLVGMAGWWLLRRGSFREHAQWRMQARIRYHRVYKRKWKTVMENGGFKREIPLARDRMPEIVRFRCTPTVDRLLVESNNCDIEDFRRVAPELGRAFNARRCTVRRDKRHDRLWLEFLAVDCLSEIIAPLEPAETPDLSAVPCGRREDGSPWTIRLLGTHTFLGAQTDAGKSSTIYSLLLGLGPAIRDGWVQVYATDPKGGAELGKIEGLCRRYEDDTVPGMIDVLRELCDVMDERGRECKRLGIDKVTGSVDMPFIVAIFDEAADLFTSRERTEDGKLWANLALSYMERLLRKGRAFGIHIFVVSQEPRKDTFPFRGLIPTGIALSLKEADEVRMVLGASAPGLGADCVGLELPRDAGRGFEIRDGSAYEFRVSWVDRERVAEMCELYAPRKAESLEDELERIAP